MTDTIAVPKEPLAEYILTVAHEVHDGDWTIHVHDDIDWPWPSVNDVDAVDVSSHKPSIIVHATVEGTWSVQTHRATRHHPAEYRTETTPVRISVEFILDGLGEVSVHAEAEDGPRRR